MRSLSELRPPWKWRCSQRVPTVLEKGRAACRGRKLTAKVQEHVKWPHPVLVCWMQSKLPLGSPWILARFSLKLRSALGSSDDTCPGMHMTCNAINSSHNLRPICTLRSVSRVWILQVLYRELLSSCSFKVPLGHFMIKTHTECTGLFEGERRRELATGS